MTSHGSLNWNTEPVWLVWTYALNVLSVDVLVLNANGRHTLSLASTWKTDSFSTNLFRGFISPALVKTTGATSEKAQKLPKGSKTRISFEIYANPLHWPNFAAVQSGNPLVLRCSHGNLAQQQCIFREQLTSDHFQWEQQIKPNSLTDGTRVVNGKAGVCSSFEIFCVLFPCRSCLLQ